jgi:hypothetical protein
MGSLSVFIFIYVLKVLALFIVLKPVSKINKKWERTYTILYNSLFFGEFAIIIFEGLFEILIAVYLVFEANDQLRTYSYIFAGVMIVICFIVVPLALIWLLTRESEKIMSLKTIEALSIDVNIRHKSNVYFYLWYFVRRIIYLIIGIYSSNYTVFQIQAFCFLNLFMIVY